LPWNYAGKAVTVLAGAERLEIFIDSRKIAKHRRDPASQDSKLLATPTLKGQESLSSTNVVSGLKRH
jgi:hypothetical protein